MSEAEAMPPASKADRPTMPCEFRSERLLLTAIVPADVDVILAAARESFGELQPWMPWAKSEPTHEQTLEFARKSTQQRAEQTNFDYSLWLGHEREGRTLERFVGAIGVHDVNWEVPHFELGYWLRTSQAGRGYATEALRQLSDTLIELYHPPRLQIHADRRNTPSQQVARRAGFTYEATLQKFHRANDDSLADIVIYSFFPDS